LLYKWRVVFCGTITKERQQNSVEKEKVSGKENGLSFIEKRQL